MVNMKEPGTKQRWLGRSVKETRAVMKYISVEKDSKLTDLNLKWSEQGKSRKYRDKIVVLTRNSVRITRGGNKYTKVDKATFTYEKNSRLVKSKIKTDTKSTRSLRVAV